MSTLMLAEVIEKLKNLNANKDCFSVRQLRDAIQNLSAELEKIADSLII